MRKKTIKEIVLWPLIGRIPFSALKRSGSGALVVVLYHIVSDEDVPHVRHLYSYKGPRQFREDLELLLKQYSPVGLSEVIDWVEGTKSLPPHCFLLTVDDGLREVHDVMAPILTQMGIPATFFLSSAFLDNRELCYDHKASLLADRLGSKQSSERQAAAELLREAGISGATLPEAVLRVDYRRRALLDRVAACLQVDVQDYLNKRRPYLTSDQTRQLIDRGFTIGAHGVDHPFYSVLSLEEQLRQTLESMQAIRKTFELDYGVFAFPHTDAGLSMEFFQQVRRSGLIDITFGNGGLAGGGTRCHLPRVNLEDPSQSATEILAWQYARRLFRDWRGGKNNRTTVV
jgi:peptidoglycan/xylan/chitin deacetylase (PgdA/CDA1 family)